MAPSPMRWVSRIQTHRRRCQGCGEEKPREEAGRRWPSASQGERLQEKSALLTP